jgi:hypothetical protein
VRRWAARIHAARNQCDNGELHAQAPSLSSCYNRDGGAG